MDDFSDELSKNITNPFRFRDNIVLENLKVLYLFFYFRFFFKGCSLQYFLSSSRTSSNTSDFALRVLTPVLTSGYILKLYKRTMIVHSRISPSYLEDSPGVYPRVSFDVLPEDIT